MKKSSKMAIQIFSTALGCVLLSTSCNNTPEPEVIPPYDAATRVATDENETVVSLQESDYSFYNNSIELYDDGGNVYDIGDPYVFRYDGKYYLYTSLNGERRKNGQIPCWVSDNLVDWEFSNWIYNPGYTAESSPSYIAFAPEIVYYKGWFYMCESRRGQGHYFFRSATPDGDYELISENLGMGIDGSFYLADTGKLYFMFADADGVVSDKRVCYVPIDFIEENGAPKVVVDDRQSVVIDVAELGGWTEGPGYFNRNGYRYFTYTGNHVDSASYKVGYASTKNEDMFKDLTARFNNVTLVSTGMDNAAVPSYDTRTGSTVSARATNFRGLGHSSNAVGPNLDSIYTAFHNADRVDFDNTPTPKDGTRQYNLTQYYTNQSYVLTNGLGNYKKTKPVMPDYTATASELTSVDDALYTAQETERLFSAELSFRLTENAGTVLLAGGRASVAVNGTTLTYTAENGSTQTASVAVSTNTQAVHTVKVVNGYKKLQLYYDNIRVLESDKCLSAGKLGYSGGAMPSSTCFTNDAFGTSDFDSVKDLTGSWPAYAYMKGENIGYSLKNASVNENGVRQGEKEKTKYVETLDATAVELKTGDWIKYAVNAPQSGNYALNVLLGAASKGSIIEAIVDNQTITKMEIPEDLKTGENGYVNYRLGSFYCEQGLHTLKIRVYGGTLDFVNVHTEIGADPLGEFTDSLENKETTKFKALLGTQYSFLTGIGLKTNTADARTLFTVGSQAVADFEFSVNVTLAVGMSGGILFRMDNYSYNSSNTVNSNTWQGYYLQFNPFYISLTKYVYAKSQDIQTVIPDKDDAFSGGNTVNVKVRCKGGNIEVYLNGYKYMEYFDADAYLTGYIGLHAESGSSLVYSQFKYKEI